MLATNLTANIECSVQAMLDANRNSLMLLHLRLTACILATGTGTFIGCFYAMNIQNTLTEATWGFPPVIVGSAIAIFAVGRSGLRALQAIRKIKMGGTNRFPFGTKDSYDRL